MDATVSLVLQSPYHAAAIADLANLREVAVRNLRRIEAGEGEIANPRGVLQSDGIKAGARLPKQNDYYIRGRLPIAPRYSDPIPYKLEREDVIAAERQALARLESVFERIDASLNAAAMTMWRA